MSLRPVMRDKLARMANGDQEVIRFLESLANQSGAVQDGDYGDINVVGGVWQIDAGTVGLLEVAPAVLDRANHTGTQDWGTITGEPTTLAGYGIADAQPLDGDLTALAGITATNAMAYRSAADTWGPVTVGAGLTFAGGVLAAAIAPRCRIYRDSNQTIPTGAGWASLSWTTVGMEKDGDFWTSGATLTIPADGDYHISPECTFDGTGLLAVATARMRILVNGATVIGQYEQTVAINAKATLKGEALRSLTAGDTILIQVGHSEMGNMTVLAQGDHSPDVILWRVAV